MPSAARTDYHARVDVLLSTSWGKHTCIFVAGASMALSAASTRSSRCRGRCLLEADGTMEIDASLKDAATDNRTFTTPLPANLAAQIFETLLPTPGLIDTPLQATITQTLPAEIATALSLSQSLSPNRLGPTPTPEEGNLLVTEEPAPLLYCPCNCTYVSAACCLSQTRLVWEEPSEQLQTRPLPNNATVCCDLNSGKWVSKSTKCLPSPSFSSNNNGAGAGGFQSLGNVRWNGSSAPHEVASRQRIDP